MSEANVYGPLVTLPQVGWAVRAHVRRWQADYVREVERAVAFGPDGATPHEVGRLPLFRSFRRAPRVDKWPEDQLPACIFGSPGLADAPRRDGRGRYSGEWVVALTAVASGADAETTEWLCGIYVAALRLLLDQQPLVPGLEVESVRWADEAYDELPFHRGRTLMAGTATFELALKDIASSAHGPLEPAADPVPDPGPFPEVQSTDLILERS